MTRREFEDTVKEAAASLPEALRARIENVSIHVAESPNRKQSGGRGTSLYGLYEGVPFGDRGSNYQMALPDRITIFKRSIERDCKTRKEMIRCIQDTVLHEFGHYFGFDDAQLDELGIG